MKSTVLFKAHYLFEKVRIQIRIQQPDPDLYQIGKQDPDPNLYQKSLDPQHCSEVLLEMSLPFDTLTNY
jgi:hypothetical protein